MELSALTSQPGSISNPVSGAVSSGGGGGVQAGPTTRGAPQQQRPKVTVTDGFERPVRTGERPYYDAAADAKARRAYYTGISLDASPGDMFHQISELITRTHTRQLEYSEARWNYLYPWVDVHPEDRKLRGIYSGEVLEYDGRRRQGFVARFAGFVASTARNVANFLGLKLNTEHTIPQSWFRKKLPMRADLHALFASSPHCNSLRGSDPYGEIPGEAGPCGESAGGVFEPPRNKGAVARATLYFLMRYPGEIDRHEMDPKTLDTLLRWHRDEPPTLWELHRNAAIAEIQGNRNPLIDHPEWAELIDFRLGWGR